MKRIQLLKVTCTGRMVFKNQIFAWLLIALAVPTVLAQDGYLPEESETSDDSDINDDLGSNLVDDSGLNQDEDISFQRAAVFGHSPIAAGSGGPKPTPLGMSSVFGSLHIPSPVDLLPQTSPPKPLPPPSTSSVSPVPNRPEDLSPEKGLFFLEYIQRLLENYPRECNQKCDLKQFKQCTCHSPALYTPDGRGNCNLGATKADPQVWCYVSEQFGHPDDVCPDARKSTTRPGYYWSRVACIT